MFTIRYTSEFISWLDGVKDVSIRAVIAARIQRLKAGLMGDVVPVGEGVSELRIHVGAGWRVYFVQHGETTVVVLGGGSKRTQAADIKRAKARAIKLIEVR
ncbi:MAG: type II toxin-antitoxin system RelE/ParE family toxin [Pseudomonadota bacterium]